ncbi:hypothetical protein ETA_07170 [Erwinia tasmaniensis Et1/99]|uniref:Uncharacterized protein n=1 Tax=Erwinia tasmaniensis (strain DSM 17950 / CFBP 7177 / CIP 109463 / NCPPB 4357 / Et1/99) TaxID=465817 RepID=B2VGP7_ERWT9|nr:hypothetical protein ETA_07170 [Erwinia tasmaniensis Et1/99]
MTFFYVFCFQMSVMTISGVFSSTLFAVFDHLVCFLSLKTSGNQYQGQAIDFMTRICGIFSAKSSFFASVS